MLQVLVVKFFATIINARKGTFDQKILPSFETGVRMWNYVEKRKCVSFMSRFFFNGSSTAKVDEKHRFVLPQSMRFGLIEDGKLEFTIAIGMGGCLTIYRRSEIEKIVEKFRAKQHNVKLQKFFTLFFSTLHHTTCDKIGRVSLPSILMRATGISDEIVVAGVLNKIEIWPRQKYEENLKAFLEDSEGETDLGKLAEEAFAMIDDSAPTTTPDVSLSDQREFENL